MAVVAMYRKKHQDKPIDVPSGVSFIGDGDILIAEFDEDTHPLAGLYLRRQGFRYGYAPPMPVAPSAPKKLTIPAPSKPLAWMTMPSSKLYELSRDEQMAILRTLDVAGRSKLKSEKARVEAILKHR